MRNLIRDYLNHILVFFLIIIFVGIYTFYLYPLQILHFVAQQSNYLPLEDKISRGTFGDMYGALNTFFSGIAFIGLIVTILIQIDIHKKEIKYNQDKEEREKQELIRNHNVMVFNKMRYLSSVLKGCHKNINQFNIDILNWLGINKTNTANHTPFIYSVTESYLLLVTERLNQEDYYVIYKNLFDDDDILDAFVCVDEALELRISLKKQIEWAINFKKEKINDFSHYDSSIKNQIINFTDSSLVAEFEAKHPNYDNQDLDSLSTFYEFLFENREKLDNNIIFEIQHLRVLYSLIVETQNNLFSNIQKRPNHTVKILTKLNQVINKIDESLAKPVSDNLDIPNGFL